jgi:hypothetical protein
MEAFAQAIDEANQTNATTVICLEENGDYPLMAPLGSISALPSIRSNITIEGNNSLIRRGFSAPAYRLLHISSGQVTVRNLTLTNGFAPNDQGGGLLVEDAELLLNNVTIIGNRAADGGGLFVDESVVTIIGGSLQDNEATSTGGGLGIFDRVSSVGLFSVTISGNSAVNGGGIALASGILHIEDSTVSDNLASNGGSFYNSDMGTLTIRGTVINGNSASFAAAGLTQSSRTTVSESCLVANQTASGADFSNAVVLEPLDAINNWWGAADGPSGVGTGSGTSISSNILYQPFLTRAPAICAP